MNLLTVSSRDVLNLGGKGGEPFVDCVNRLLRAEATMAGRPTAAVTTLGINERDGGVGCEVAAHERFRLAGPTRLEPATSGVTGADG